MKLCKKTKKNKQNQGKSNIPLRLSEQLILSHANTDKQKLLNYHQRYQLYCHKTDVRNKSPPNTIKWKFTLNSKFPMIQKSNTIVYPEAVMVPFINTSRTLRTVAKVVTFHIFKDFALIAVVVGQKVIRGLNFKESGIGIFHHKQIHQRGKEPKI
ncbi:hypothetical protein BpHYR1_008266 [Brachionus plicatilis]|uniref:Uncharacterized protein n=1 Tax=Brachionus plicatilis TaxID=10195 RepID=A0A3M7STJ2_BRAPC|nr:hypothetical protein BpHYR1_008266 [Brachionus plicatilis]